MTLVTSRASFIGANVGIEWLATCDKPGLDSAARSRAGNPKRYPRYVVGQCGAGDREESTPILAIAINTAAHGEQKPARVTKDSVLCAAAGDSTSGTTFEPQVGAERGGDSHRQMWIPHGLAHDLLVLGDSTGFLCLTTAYWAPSAEQSLRCGNPELEIHWPKIAAPTILAKARVTPHWTITNDSLNRH